MRAPMPVAHESEGVAHGMRHDAMTGRPYAIGRYSIMSPHAPEWGHEFT